MTRVIDELIEPSVSDMVASRLAAEVLTIPGIRSLGLGRFRQGDAITDGIEFTPSEIRVHVVVGYPEGFPLPGLIDRVKRRVIPYAEDRSVAVVIEDVEDG